MTQSRVPPELSGTVVLRDKVKPHLQMLQDGPESMRVEVLGGPMDGLRTIVSGETLGMGRAEDNDLVLPLDRGISGHHARIVRDGMEFSIEDLQSRNGTFIGEKRVLRRAPMRPGMVVVLGATCLEFMPH